MEDIAVIGVSCRFPGKADNVENLWKVLLEGQNCWSEVPGDRFHENAFYNDNHDNPGTHNHKGGHFLAQNVAAFDAQFFGISNNEAEAMDPQQRLLLEVTYEAIENSGLPLHSVEGSQTGVYAAIFARDYDRNSYRDPLTLPRYHLTGCGEAILSNRISHFFDFHGPSMTIDTGCSGSLVALHLACQSLRSGESSMAIAAGSNLILGPDHMLAMTNVHMLNSQGRSFSFDERGSGYGRGEGCAAVVLTRLDYAMNNRLPIRAVVKATGVNQDGRTPGITLPSTAAQESLLRTIYQNSNLDPEDLEFVEAHGTGTIAGDRAEVDAIAKVLSHQRTKPLTIGSIKSNLGHLEAASGLAGLLKAILMLEKKKLVPNADFLTPKQEIEWEKNNVEVCQKHRDLNGKKVYSVAVNSFGYGGTNAHAVLQSTSQPQSHIATCGSSEQTYKVFRQASHDPRQNHSYPYIFTFSAHLKSSLVSYMGRIRDWLAANKTDEHVRDLTWTLARHRSHFDWRYSFPASSITEALKSLEVLNKAINLRPANRNLLFVFTGQGSQWPSMGCELLAVNETFRDSMLENELILQQLGATWSLSTELMKTDKSSRLNEGQLSQPAITAVQISLVDLLDSMAICPAIVVGHSSGEIAAAYAAKRISKVDALKVALHRGLASAIAKQQTSPDTTMLAVGLGVDEVAHYTEKYEALTIACDNSSQSTTISGPRSSLLALKSDLDKNHVVSRMLKVDIAYHSPFMKSGAGYFLSSLDGMKNTSTTSGVIFVSSVSCSTEIRNFDAQYWTVNLESRVRYREALEKSVKAHRNQGGGTLIAIEIGPHSALRSPTRQCLSELGEDLNFAYLSTLQRDKDSRKCILELLAGLFQLGVTPNFVHGPSLVSDEDYKIVSTLPTYCWDHSNTYWKESRLSYDYRFRKAPPHHLLGARLMGSTSLNPIWTHHISLEKQPWLTGHKIDELVLFPASGYICMAMESFKELYGSELDVTKYKLVLTDIEFIQALIVSSGSDTTEVHTLMTVPGGQEQKPTEFHEFCISSSSTASQWERNCRGKIRAESSIRDHDGFVSSHPEGIERSQKTLRITKVGDAEDNPSERNTTLERGDVYDSLAACGNRYEGPFACTTMADLSEDLKVTSVVCVPQIEPGVNGDERSKHIIHPTTLDAIFHGSLLAYHTIQGKDTIIPVRISKMQLHLQFPNEVDSEIKVLSDLMPGNSRTASVSIVAGTADIHGSFSQQIFVEGLELQGLGKQLQTKPSDAQKFHKIEWLPDIDFFNQNMLDGCNEGTKKLPLEEINYLNDQAAFFINTACQTLKDKVHTVDEGHPQHFLKWMQERSQQNFNRRAEFDNTIDHVTLQQYHVENLMLQRIGRQLSSCVLGDVSTLELMNEGGLFYQLYRDQSTRLCHEYMAYYLRHLAFKVPHLKVLEVGGGTAAASQECLRALSELPSMIDTYTFTDVSSGFIEHAKSNLSTWQSTVRYAKLDIELDPLSQGFNEHHFDVIIASNVIHATSSITKTLTNLRKLLVPGGKLIFVEITEPQLYLNVIFGTLPGWWKGIEDDRREGPLLSVEQWNRRLQEAGFDEIAVCKHDYEGDQHISTMMIAEALVVPITFEAIHIIEREPFDLAIGLESCLADSRLEVTKSSVLSPSTTGCKTIILVDSEPVPLLARLTADNFNAFRALLQQTEVLFWFRIEQNLLHEHNAGLITGFARTSQAENENLKIITSFIQQDNDMARSDVASILVGVIQNASKQIAKSTQSLERDYHFADDMFYIPRILEYQQAAKLNSPTGRKGDAERAFIYDETRNVPTTQMSNSIPTDLVFAASDTKGQELDQNDVEIELEALVLQQSGKPRESRDAVDRKDLQRFAGTVRSVGHLSKGYKIGDRVCGWATGLRTDVVRTSQHNICVVPENLSNSIGVAMSIEFTIAYHCMVILARLCAGQSVILYKAPAELTYAFAILASKLNVTLMGFVEDGRIRQDINARMGTKSALLLDPDIEVVGKVISDSSKSIAIGAFINCCTESYDDFHLELIAPTGIYIEVAKYDELPVGQAIQSIMPKNIACATVDFWDLQASQPTFLHQTFEKAMSMFATCPTSLPATIKFVNLDQVDDDSWTKSTLDSKVVIEFNKASVKKFTQPSSMSTISTINRDGTYLVVGGMGDLGRETCRFLAEQGASIIVAIGRSDRAPDEVDKFAQEIRSYKRQTVFKYITCDVSKKDQIEGLAQKISSSQMPSVHGIVHSAVVLKDRMLESMTYAEFDEPLQNKVHGCLNLNSVFGGADLDFFVMFSSGSGIVGSQGQANYAAASTFMDRFAYCFPDSKTHHVSIDFGPIEGTDVVTSTRYKYLTEQGLRSVSLQEFRSALKLAISHEAREARLHQFIVGIGSLAASDLMSKNNLTINQAFFSHLRKQDEKIIKQSKPTTSITNFSDLVKTVTDRNELAENVGIMLTTKVSSLVAITNQEIGSDSLIDQLGLDSLMVIELRNYIRTTFSCMVSTRDILDHSTIASLAATIVNMSNLCRAESETQSETTVSGTTPQTSGSVSPTKESDRQRGHDLCHLPKLPLPDLSESLEQVLTSRKAFLSEDDYHRFEDVCKNFAKSQGSGHKLQERFAKLASKPGNENWQHDFYADKIYLERRDPIHPNTTFWGAQKTIGQVEHSQARRAAIISMAAIEFRKAVQSGTLEPDTLEQEPLCLGIYTWLFNACRVPHHGLDRMSRSPNSDYLIVLRRGHIFRLDWSKKDGDETSIAEMEARFEAILQKSNAAIRSVACLTAGQRDEWAAQRTQLQTSEKNARILQLIEAAAFVVCLDDGRPETATERCNQFYLDHPENRWSDKNLQLVVTENGISAFVCEHSALDGLSLRKFNQALTAAILETGDNGSRRGPAVAEPATSQSFAIEELILEQLPQNVDDIITANKKRVQSLPAVELTNLDLEAYGRSLFRTHKISPRTGFQIVIQVANYLYYGCLPETWETISLARFHNGRVDWNQAVSPEMVKFCSTIVDVGKDKSSSTISDCRRLLLEAANIYTNSAARISRGQGYKAHLHSLWCLAERQANGDEAIESSIPDFFRDPEWIATSVPSIKRVKTDCLDDMEIAETCFFMPEPQCIYVHYEISDESVHFFVQTWTGRSKAYCDALLKAADMVQNVLGG